MMSSSIQMQGVYSGSLPLLEENLTPSNSEILNQKNDHIIMLLYLEWFKEKRDLFFEAVKATKDSNLSFYGYRSSLLMKNVICLHIQESQFPAQIAFHSELTIQNVDLSAPRLVLIQNAIASRIDNKTETKPAYLIKHFFLKHEKNYRPMLLLNNKELVRFSSSNVQHS